MASGFAGASRLSEEKLAEWIRAPITGKLTEVPSIGPAGEKVLIENGVSTTFGLIGKYLMLKEEGVGPVENADRFFYWLESINLPGGHRASVCHAIAERVNISFPGIYDPDAY